MAPRQQPRLVDPTETAMKWELPVMRHRLLRIRYPVVGLHDQDETAGAFFSFGFSTRPEPTPH